MEIRIYKARQLSRTVWKLACRKSACCCDAKHILKSTCANHIMFRPLLEVEMSQNCTPLCANHMSNPKLYKHHIGPLLEVQMSFCVAGIRDGALRHTQKRENLWPFQNVGRCKTFEEDLERCMWRSRCTTREPVPQRC